MAASAEDTRAARTETVCGDRGAGGVRAAPAVAAQNPHPHDRRIRPEVEVGAQSTHQLGLSQSRALRHEAFGQIGRAAATTAHATLAAPPRRQLVRRSLPVDAPPSSRVLAAQPRAAVPLPQPPVGVAEHQQRREHRRRVRATPPRLNVERWEGRRCSERRISERADLYCDCRRGSTGA
eukprot:ctg_213.g99